MSTPRNSTLNLAARWFAGFFGAAVAVAILPRTLVYLFRRVVGRLLAEVLVFALLGLVSRRLGEPGKRP